MAKTRTVRRTAALAATLAALAVLVLLPLAAAEPAVRIQRDLPSTGPAGSQIPVVLHIDWPEGPVTGLAIEEVYPPGAVVEHAAEGGSTESPGRVKWFLLNQRPDAVAYTVRFPDSAKGDKVFDGVYRDDVMVPGEPDAAIAGDARISIEAAAGLPGPGAAAALGVLALLLVLRRGPRRGDSTDGRTASLSSTRAKGDWPE